MRKTRVSGFLCVGFGFGFGDGGLEVEVEVPTGVWVVLKGLWRSANEALIMGRLVFGVLEA